MKLDFARNTKRNMLANAMSSGIKLLFPFLNRTLFLWLLGPEYLGLNGLFGSVLGVLMLAELGFGTAVVCSMYKSVANDDRELLCAYLKFYRTVYRWVGTAIFVVGLCLLPFIRQIVHGNVPPDVDLHILYLIHLVNTSASYFLFAYRGSVLGAHHRNDVITNIRTGVQVTQYLVVFLILLLTRNYYHYVCATVVFTVAQNVLLVKASRKLFPDIEPRGRLPDEMRRKVISDVKSIFMHKVGGVVVNSMDNIVLSAFLGLVAVAAYGNYYYVVTAVAGVTAIVSTSMTGGFGNKIYTETKEKNFDLFIRMLRLMLTFAMWCAAMMMALYQPFIEVWTKGDPQLSRHILTAVLMVLFFYVNQSRQMLMSFKTAAGFWRQDRWKPIVSGALNLTLNISMVLLLPAAYKLDGVILSTILAFLIIEIPWETRVVFANYFDCAGQARTYWCTQARFAATAVATVAATWFAARAVPLEGLVGLVAKGGVAAFASASLAAVFCRRDIAAILKSRSGSWGK